MDLENTFDLFGRQILNKNSSENIVDIVKEKIKSLKTQFGDHVSKTENLVNAIGVTKNYINLKNKRIVGVKPSIDKYDVVIKSELEEVIDSIIKFEKEYSDITSNLKGLKKSDYKDLKKFIHNINLTESEKTNKTEDKRQILDVKSMRIRNVSKGVENYDAIVKLQLDNAISTLTTSINNNHAEVMSTVNSKIDEINSRISTL